MFIPNITNEKKGNRKMKNKFVTALILAAMCAASVTSCGTVESLDESSAGTTEASTEEITTTEEAAEAVTTTEASTTEEATTEEATEEETTEAESETDAPADEPETEAPAAEPETAAPETAAPETEAPETEAPTEAPVPAGSFSGNDLTFSYGGANGTLFYDAAGLISALGSPSSVDEAQGCLSNGADMKVYHYGGIDVSVYLEGGSEILYDITITSGAYPTSKGLAVGMSYADCVAMYGEGTDCGGGLYCYSSSSGYLYISTSGDTVTCINYYAEV